MSRTRRAVAGALLVAVPVVAGGFVWQSREARDGAMLFDQVLRRVSERFVDTVDATALYEKAARGLVTQLNDPYTVLYTPKEFAAFTQGTNGRYAGVGMQIEDIRGNITVARVFPNTPAAQNGIAEGDRIVMIDSVSTRGWGTDSVSSKLKGDPGTRVRVRFQRPPIERGAVEVAETLVPDAHGGHVPLPLRSSLLAAPRDESPRPISRFRGE